jgi:hypothetical protein
VSAATTAPAIAKFFIVSPPSPGTLRQTLGRLVSQAPQVFGQASKCREDYRESF